MNTPLKYGLVALLIYVILTLLGVFVEKNFSQLEILAQIMAGTFFFVSSLLNVDPTHSIFGFISSFIIGAVVWFLVGLLLGWIVRNKETPKEKFLYMGKILMIVSVILFLVTEVFFQIFFKSISFGEVDPLAKVLVSLLLLGIFGVPFIMGFIFWLIGKFKK